MKKKICVVAAIIKQENKYLIAQRSEKGSLGNKWEFPGGKIEENETKEEALIREVQEELNIEIKIKKEIGITEYKYPFAIINISFMDCEMLSQKSKIKLNVHKKLEWVSKKEFKTYDLADSDLEIIKILK